ncbi:MAG: gamma-glutamyltransferase [Pseudomonadota bacterium]|nr:gamma-glutamyltransferase [Pseudomonadota bacterium]
MSGPIYQGSINTGAFSATSAWLGAVKDQIKFTTLNAINSCTTNSRSLINANAAHTLLALNNNVATRLSNIKSIAKNKLPSSALFSNLNKNALSRNLLPLQVIKLVQSLRLNSLFGNTAENNQHEFGIATPHPLATEAGLQVLKEGGNAYDAAVAVTAALAVVEPFGSGLGGGGAWLLHDAEKDQSVFIDGREKAPMASTEKMYQKEDGSVDRELATNHPLAAAIPGTPAALVHVQQKYGSMSLERLLKPAIEYAEKGFPITSKYVDVLKSSYASVIPLKVLQKWPSSAGYLDHGQLPQPGWTLKQPELANTLKALAVQGRKGFYEGDIAKAMVKEVQNNGGIWTLNDLAQYDVAEREPVSFNYRDYKITSGSLPSSGGLVMAGIFGQLDKHNYHDASEADRAHLFIEAMRNAYYQRAKFMGDADFTQDTGEWLMQPSSIDAMASHISLDKARPSSEMPLISDGTSGTQTTHFSVIDGKGNRAAVTLSLNAYFGSGFTAKGTGVLLNNEMDDFSAKPSEPNAYGLVGSEANKIEPGKRPLSSMTPSFLEGPKGVHVLGTPGGSRIISMVSQGMLDAIDGKSAKDIVAKGRIHHQYLPDVVEHEAGAIDNRIKQNLESRGHTFKQTPNPYGNLQVVHWDKANQVMNSAADPRREGLALVGQSIA